MARLPTVHPRHSAPARPGEARLLVAELLGDDDVASEAAAARLAILGRPSVRPLLQALETAEPAHAVRVLGVLERLADPLTLPAVAAALDSGTPEIAEAAVWALSALLQATKDTVATAALDRLTAAALDTSRPRSVRLAALRALASLELEAVALVRAQLLSDPDEDVRRAAGGADDAQDGAQAEAGPTAVPGRGQAEALAPRPPDNDVVRAAVAGALPDDPETLRVALGHADAVSVSDLHRLIVVLREAERQAPESPAAGWLACRAAVHQVLADRDSRVAVYDLRDTLEALGPQAPVGILSALRDVGDAASLDVIVEAWAAHADPWFRSQLASAFGAIVTREGLTRRHAVVRRVAQRHPDALAALWAAAQERAS